MLAGLIAGSLLSMFALYLQSLSSQSLPVHTSMRENPGSHPSPPSSLYNYPLYSQMKPASASTYAIPLANSTLLGHSHISGSNSSISSTKSANQTYSHTHLAQDRGNHGYSRHRLPADSVTRQFRVPFSSTPRYPSSEREGAGLDRTRTRCYHRDPHTNGTRRHSGHGASWQGALRSSDDVRGNPFGQATHGASRQGAPRSSCDDVRGDPRGQTTLTPSSGSIPMASSDVELQRSKLKIKQLEKEVNVIM